jgi:hypothetical protein
MQQKKQKGKILRSLNPSVCQLPMAEDSRAMSKENNCGMQYFCLVKLSLWGKGSKESIFKHNHALGIPLS